MVLILSYFVSSTLHVIATIGVHHSAYQFWLIPFGITTAIAGWLTDAFIGRYKVIRCSVWIMWLFMIIATVSAIVEQLNEVYHHYDKAIRPALFCPVSIGLGGFQANIVQFGLDQLHDPSTTEITSFIITPRACAGVTKVIGLSVCRHHENRQISKSRAQSNS